MIGALAAFGALGLGNVFATELTDAPLNLVVKAADGNAGRTVLVLTWDAPAVGETPTGYRIDVSTRNDKYKYLAMTDANTRTHTHSGIKGSTSGVHEVLPGVSDELPRRRCGIHLGIRDHQQDHRAGAGGFSRPHLQRPHDD